MSYIVGVDIALRNTGIVVLKTRPLSFGYHSTIKYRGSMVDGGTYKESEDFYAFLRDSVPPLIPKTEDSILWVVEGMPRYGHYESAIKISTARTNFYRIISEMWPESKVLVPRVFVWKKELLGKSNAGKGTTKTFLLDNYGYIPGIHEVVEQEDTMDAAALALWGLSKDAN